MQPTRPLNAAVKAEVTAELNGLPRGRITEHHGAAYVFTDRLADIEAWYLALGGRITHKPVGDGTTIWSLDTLTERTHGAPVRVRCMALDTDQIDADCADAVTPTPTA
jgi:hypothetical protein